MQTIWALVWARFVVGYPVVMWWLLVTGLVNLLAHRSQVDAWCEARPRLAAFLKFARGIGFDPWLLVQGSCLALKGRLPERLRYFPILAVLLLTGCAGTFETSRLVTSRGSSPSSSALSARCHQLDDRRQLYGGIAKGAAVVAGGVGLASIPAESKGARIGLAAGGVGAAAVAAGAVYVAELAGQSWAEECAQ